MACPANQVDFAQTELLQRLEFEHPPENGLEIEWHSGSCLAELVVFVECAAAELRNLDSFPVQDFALQRAPADVVASSLAACEIAPDSRLAGWYWQEPQAALPLATSIHLPVVLGNDQRYPRKVSFLSVHSWTKADCPEPRQVFVAALGLVNPCSGCH